MKAVVQRVRSATLDVNSERVASIETGLVILAGIAAEDGARDLKWMAEKVVNLRIFEDDAGKMNRSLLDVGGDILLVPNFTVAGDCRTGRRPSFTTAKHPDDAGPMFDQFVELVRGYEGITIERGVFGEDMLVTIGNDGPITLIVESPQRT